MNTNLLHNKWVYHPEENTDSEMVYRPENKAVLSRNRKSFELRQDGSFLQSDLGPADRLDESKGTWKLEDNNLYLYPDTDKTPAMRLQINSLNPDKLTIKK